jgi:hypothetical protein
VRTLVGAGLLLLLTVPWAAPAPALASAPIELRH